MNNKTNKTKLKTPTVPALERGLALLELLATSKSGLTLPELTRRLELPKSSTHCLLVTLERLGYLRRNEKTGRYLFGLKLFSLANLALSGLDLREQAAPYLRALMERTRFTVHMAILEQGEAVLVEKVEAPGLLKLASWVGKRMEVHCTGLGKALLAHLPEAELDRLIREHGLPRYNENTIRSARRLKENLTLARQQGYTLDDEEEELGFRCLGAPLRDHTGSVVAAISVAGTTAQITPENLPALAREVKKTAAAISLALGFHPDGARA